MARRYWKTASIPLLTGIALAPSLHAQAGSARGSAQVQGPRFEVDLYWPQPLPRHQLLGSVVGLAVDSRDHVFVVHLTDSFTARTEIGATVNPPIGECCMPAAAVLEFDPDGKLVGQWGGPGQGYTWPTTPNGLAIDGQGNVWIGGAGGVDAQILKFSRDGKFVAAYGKAGAPAPAAAAPTAADTAYTGVSGAGRAAGGGGAGGRGGGGRAGGGRGGPALPANSTSMDSFGGPMGFAFNSQASEVFVADGARNHRIAVVDMNSGAIKRVWGANGRPPTDGPATQHTANAAQFGNPVSCVERSNDGMVYVCDRANNRIQVFRATGEFVREASVAPTTKGAGSVWDLAFSRDAQQQHIYVADGQNMKVRVLNRQTLQEVTNFGDGGRQAGKFSTLHSVATDSRGNVYTAEALQGKRVQKFIFKGIGQVARQQGVVWPGR